MKRRKFIALFADIMVVWPSDQRGRLLARRREVSNNESSRRRGHHLVDHGQCSM
jgi:hypothetical protein